MLTRSALTPAIIASSILLASCGGGGSSSTPDDMAGAGNDDGTMTPVSGDNIDADGNSDTDADTDPVNIAGSPLCADNVPTSSSVIGNNTYVFDAATGQCFGRNEEVGLDKRLVPLTITEEFTREPINALVEASANLRMVINRGDSFLLGEITDDSYIFDITNTHSLPVCINSNELNMVSAAGDIIETYPDMEIAGDHYEVTPENPLAATRYDNCIPPGETRSMYGSWLFNPDASEGEVLPTFTSVEVSMEIEVLEDPAVLSEPLMPGEFSWSAAAQDEDTSFLFPYLINVSVQNPTAQTIEMANFGDLLFLDGEGFLVHVDQVAIANFLGENSVDLTDEQLTLSAAGGMLTYANNPGFDNVDNQGPDGIGFDGPASRVMLHVEQDVVGNR